MSTQEYVAALLASAPKPRPEQLARIAAILIPAAEGVPIGTPSLARRQVVSHAA